jgi:hypothetical protein
VLEPPQSDFANEFIEKLCKSNFFDKEVDPYNAKEVEIHNKAVELLRILNSETIDLEVLRKLAFTGVPH